MAKTKGASSSDNIISKILGLIIGAADPEREKRRQLKNIKKNLNRAKGKFYKPSGDVAQTSLAKFFYEIYKTVGHTQILLEAVDSSEAIKSILIEFYFTDIQRDIAHKILEDQLRQRATEVDIKTLANEVKEDLVDFFAGFDINKVREINHTYNKLLYLVDFIRYDYYFLLKKFDSGLPERDFSYNPRFESINGEYISEDIKDFLAVIPFIEPDGAWERVMDVLKEYKGIDVINRQDWAKMLRNLMAVKRSGQLLMIAQYLDKDPYYVPFSENYDEHIVENYLQALKTRTEGIIQKLIKEQKNAKKDKLLSAVFGTTIITRTKYYTEKNNMMFSRKAKGGFQYIEPINFLKAFMLDILKRDLKELVDLLLIRGKWSTNLMSQQVSDAFYKCLDISQMVIEFDESLADEGPVGAKLKQAALRAERDKAAAHVMTSTLNDVNDKAKELINTSAQNLISIGKGLKMVIEDYNKPKKELIINWKEIESAADKEMLPWMSDIYKRMFYFVQLLQSYMKKGVE